MDYDMRFYVYIACVCNSISIGIVKYYQVPYIAESMFGFHYRVPLLLYTCKFIIQYRKQNAIHIWIMSLRVLLTHRNSYRKTSIPRTWWRHQMETFFRVTGHLCGDFTGHRWIPHAKASDAELWCFLWSAPWINGWVNNRDAGDLRCHPAHYDVTVMELTLIVFYSCLVPVEFIHMKLLNWRRRILKTVQLPVKQLRGIWATISHFN